jgi:hypothetical protein
MLLLVACYRETNDSMSEIQAEDAARIIRELVDQFPNQHYEIAMVLAAALAYHICGFQNETRRLEVYENATAFITRVVESHNGAIQ